MYIYFVLARTVETLHKINYFSLLKNSYFKKICTHYTFGLLISKEKLKGKGIISCHLSPSFYAIIFSIRGWLIQGSKKEYDRVSWPFVFLEVPLPSFCIWNNSVTDRKHTCFVLALTLADLPHIMGPLQFCVNGASHMPCANRMTWEGKHAYCT